METSRSLHLIIALSVLLLLGSTGLLRATDDIPKRPPFDRYIAMMNKSPFAVATAVAPVAAAPSFAKDLYVANAAHLIDGDLVTLQSSVDRNMKEYLTTKGPNERGYAISSIEWSEKQGQTKVTISKDGQFATLTFNQALMTAPPPTNPGPPAAPGQPSVPVPTYVPPPRPANGAGLPTPPPHIRGPIQRNPNTVQARPNQDIGVDQ